MNTQHINFLVVEDNPGDSRLVAEMLREAGGDRCSVDSATHLRDAIARLSRGGIDVVLLDLNLPDATGIETFRTLNEKFPDLPVIVFTGVGDQALALQAVRSGAQDYMIKGRATGESLLRAASYAIERARSSHELRAAYGFLQSAIDALPEHIAILDPSGVIIAVNERWRRFAIDNGMESAQFGVGTNYLDVTDQTRGVEAARVAEIGKGIRDVLEGRRHEFRTEYPCHGPQDYRWFALYCTRFENQGRVFCIVAHENITQLRWAQESLRQSEDRYRRLVESSPYGVLLEQGGRVAYANQAAAVLFGVKSPWELVTKQAARLFQPLLAPAAAPDGDHRPVPRRITHADGTAVDVLVSTIACDLGGEPAVQIVMEDVTERNRLQEELIHAQRMEAVGQLASGVAHDFNNLLTAIFGSLAIARSRLSPDDAALADLERVEQAARQASAVTHSLVTFTHKGPAQRSVVSLDAVARSAAELVRRMLPPGVDLLVKPSLGGNAWVLGDSAQLQQVALNLAINARDAMPAGGTLTISVQTIPPEPNDAEAPLGLAALVVTDTGIGMTEGVRARIFEPFYTTKPRGQGTGLGLAIVHGIVREHNGRIDVSSDPGTGSTFRILLPLATLHSAAKPELVRRMHREPEDAAAPPPKPAGTVLLAEDQAAVRDLMASALRAHGYTVHETSDGREFLSEFKLAQNSVAAYILDLDLPGCDGSECARQVRQAGVAAPIVIVTGRIDRHLPVADLANTHLLRKPFGMTELTDLISTLIAPAR